jgi:hypothetical protein
MGKTSRALHRLPKPHATEPEPERRPEPQLIPAARTDESTPLEAFVDGKRVVIDAGDEIVLRCGKASITLRRNGRIVIRGSYIETRSQGTNRIRGGSVQIN